MHRADPAERVITVEREVIARTDIGLKGRPSRERTAEHPSQIRNFRIVTCLQRAEIDGCPVSPEKWRLLDHLTVIPGATGLEAKPAREACHQGGFDAAHTVVATVDE